MAVVTRVPKVDHVAIEREAREVAEAKLQHATDVIEEQTALIERLVAMMPGKAFATHEEQQVRNRALAFLAQFGRGERAARQAEVERAYEAWQQRRKEQP